MKPVLSQVLKKVFFFHFQNLKTENHCHSLMSYVNGKYMITRLFAQLFLKIFVEKLYTGSHLQRVM